MHDGAGPTRNECDAKFEEETENIVRRRIRFTDLTSSKRRPALVLSPDSFNAAGRDLVLAAITSHIRTTRTPCFSGAATSPRGDFPRRRW